MLNPCRLCLVKPNCSSICDEKRAWDKKFDIIKLPIVLVSCFSLFLILVVYTLILMILNHIGILSDEKYRKLDPFIEIDAMDEYYY